MAASKNIQLMKNSSSYFLAIIIFVSACATNETEETSFIHDVTAGPKPWTSEVFEAEEEDFTFGIIADLTGGEREGIFNVAVAQVNRLEPTFVLSVGDLIEGGSLDTTVLKNEWDNFDARAANFTVPFFYLGGNHDLSNPVMQDFWHKRFGPTYYHFVYNNVLFLMLDSEDFEYGRMMEIHNARTEAMKIIYGEVEGDFTKTEYYNMPERRTGAMSEAQISYFQDVLQKYQDVRWTFVFMHKPLYTRDDSKGLGRLEAGLSTRSYTVINGHEHSFSHQIRNDMDYIMLGTTGGFQNDKDDKAFDHFTLVRMAKDKPVITHLRMDGVLDETGAIPLGGDSLSFQASKQPLL